MIYSVSASPRIDKGAVVQALAARHNLTVVPDPARALCKAYGFQTLYDMPFELQRAVRMQLVHDHLPFLSSAGDVVLEFSIAEWLADWMRWFWGRTPTEAWEGVMATAARAAERYNAVVHLDDGPARAYDGYAWLDRRNSSQVNVLLKVLYGELGLAGKLAPAPVLAAKPA
jgi:hypothetical protein